MRHVLTGQRQSGAGLIEVLVTVLILATSLLAMGALQSRSLQFNHSAYLRSQANILAYDILDRMRINRQNIADYDGLALADDAPKGTDLADKDVREWLTEVARLLPGGDGAIDCTDTLCTVSLRWVDEDELPGDIAEDADVQYTTFTYSSQV